MIGRGVAYRKTDETDLCWSAMVETGVLFIGRQRNAWEPTGWVGTECVVVFIGRAWTEQAMETRPEWGHVDREGSGVPQNGGNGPPTVETGVLLIGRGVVYRKTDETDLLRSKRGSC